MQHSALAALFVLINLLGQAFAQETPTPRVINLSTTIDGQEYTCAVIINEQATKGGPAILFLHGYGESGTDYRKQLTVGLPPRAKAHPEQWPFVLIAPQKPVFNSEWEKKVKYFTKKSSRHATHRGSF